MKKAYMAMVLYISTFSNTVFAKDFGNRGANYPVAEESILVSLQRKFAELDLKKEEERMRSIAEERIRLFLFQGLCRQRKQGSFGTIRLISLPRMRYYLADECYTKQGQQ